MNYGGKELKRCSLAVLLILVGLLKLLHIQHQVSVYRYETQEGFHIHTHQNVKLTEELFLFLQSFSISFSKNLSELFSGLLRQRRIEALPYSMRYQRRHWIAKKFY